MGGEGKERGWGEELQTAGTSAPRAWERMKDQEELA